MGSTAVDLAHRMFDAYNSRDIDFLLTVLHPDVHVHSLLTEAERADYHGHEGAREWFVAVVDVFPDWSPRIDQVREVDDDTVLIALTAVATAPGSGVQLEQGFWQGVHLRDGLLDYFGFFRSEDDAREGLGLGSPGARE